MQEGYIDDDMKQDYQGLIEFYLFDLFEFFDICNDVLVRNSFDNNCWEDKKCLKHPKYNCFDFISPAKLKLSTKICPLCYKENPENIFSNRWRTNNLVILSKIFPLKSKTKIKTPL